jgi:hypothetical protein
LPNSGHRIEHHSGHADSLIGMLAVRARRTDDKGGASGFNGLSGRHDERGREI